MNTSWIEPAYQAMRAWALHPSPMRPPGVAQLLQGGMAYWIDVATPLPDEDPDWESASAVACPPTPLSTIVAAMIAQVSS